LACLSYFQTTTGMVVDINSRSVNISAMVNEKMIASLKFDDFEHGVEPDFEFSLPELTENPSKKLHEKYV
jgi:hypothetical protein